tara:strand:+ start:418 stop:1296 length:879 start_codon:yes stop_codon:yes gene_type:complete
MAFGLNINFGGIIGNLTKGLKNIATSKIQNLSSMVKTSLINTANNSVGINLQSIIGTSLNLKLSNITGSLNFSNLLKNIPFPNLSSMNINALWGAIDENIGKNINAFAKNLSNVYKKINLDDLNLTDKINGSINSQFDNISNEIDAGIIAGKSSLDVLGNLNNLSNKQIRDFSFNPDLQLDFVNGLVKKQQDKIFDLSFNGITESSVFDNQISGLTENNIDSFISGETTNLDFSFNSDKLIDNVSINSENIDSQSTQINKIVQTKLPVARKVNLKRYNKENETLEYLKVLEI